jgi:hypothetical protein
MRIVFNFKSCSENISKTSQLIAFNTHCWPRRAVVQLPDAVPEKLVMQKLKCGGTLGELIVCIVVLSLYYIHNMNCSDCALIIPETWEWVLAFFHPLNRKLHVFRIKVSRIPVWEYQACETLIQCYFKVH